MAELKDTIEELIEESYLMGRSESEIKADLDRFIDACEKVIREQVRDKGKLEDLAEKLVLARTCSLVSDLSDSGHEGGALREEGGQKSSAERFAEKVARNKRIILKAIGKCDPRLVDLIERERFPGVVREPKRPKVSIKPRKVLGERSHLLVLRFCYGLTLIFIFYLIYLVWFQKI
ncbi:MAG: hypothetical protein EXS64_12890 [Candidatus Latescibacteria bacterium]|nr:hypothetical protein [Candidatus Latescibacterota bacterium]